MNWYSVRFFQTNTQNTPGRALPRANNGYILFWGLGSFEFKPCDITHNICTLYNITRCSSKFSLNSAGNITASINDIRRKHIHTSTKVSCLVNRSTRLANVRFTDWVGALTNSEEFEVVDDEGGKSELAERVVQRTWPVGETGRVTVSSGQYRNPDGFSRHF